MSDKKTETAPEDKPKFIAKPDGADPMATRLIAELKHDRGILACRYDPKSPFLFAGARDYFLHRWDLTREAVVEPPADPKKKPRTPPIPAVPADARVQLTGHHSWVASIAVFDDGKAARDRRLCRSIDDLEQSIWRASPDSLVRSSQRIDSKSRRQP